MKRIDLFLLLRNIVSETTGESLEWIDEKTTIRNPKIYDHFVMALLETDIGLRENFNWGLGSTLGGLLDQVEFEIAEF